VIQQAASINGWTCKREAPIGLRLPVTVCRETATENDHSPGTPHPVVTWPY
jgi:hypothetical protein